MKQLIYLFLLFISFSCANRNLVYFRDLDQKSQVDLTLPETIQPTIQKDDLLRITVSSLSPESNILFNVGLLNANTNTNLPQQERALNEAYLVDESGEINFPVLGKIKLEGLTKTQAMDEMYAKINEFVKDPIINIRFANFKVTVIGEVNKPSTFVVPTEKISLLEALGLAGDMTMYGKRENVLIIREVEGSRTAVRINLNTKEFLTSPYYYLHQNDVVYVEPDRIKAVQASTNQRALTIFGIAASFTVTLLFNLRFFLNN